MFQWKCFQESFQVKKNFQEREKYEKQLKLEITILTWNWIFGSHKKCLSSDLFTTLVLLCEGCFFFY